MNYFFRYLALLSVIFFSLLSPRMVVHAGEPIVHAVLFYSPTCPHCHKVITEDLIPLLDKYGEALSVLGIDTYTEQGQEIYQAAIIHFQIPNERRGVEIPEQFPSIIESKLTEGGVDWPDIPGLDELIEEVPVEPEAEALEENEIDQSQSAVEEEVLQSVDFADKDIEKTKPNQVEGSSNTTNGLAEAITTTETMTLPERFMRDKTGNSISILVLLGMVISMIWVGIKVLGSNQVTKKWPNWVIPLLLLIGLGVAIYMGYVEITQTEAVGGPVGDCNTVQQSPYARLFGLLPVGVLGLLGYLALMLAWTIQYYGPAGWKEPATWVFWGMALFGTIFSIYLTFLEPFVIGATCAWCLTSAVVITLLLWAATTPVMQSRIASRHTLQSSGSRHPHPDLK
jgi:uncharacterized membrane protein